MTSLAILSRDNWKRNTVYVIYLECELNRLIKKNFFETGKLIHVYGWIITGRSETFDFDAEYIDR